MTEREKKALHEAFGFEEPDRKEEFTAEFIRLAGEKNRKPLFPVIIKFAAAAAMMTAVVGTAVMMPKNLGDLGNLSSNEVITEPSSETEPVETTAAIAVTSQITTVKTVTSETNASRTAKTSSAEAVKTTVTGTSKTASYTSENRINNTMAQTTAPQTVSTAAANAPQKDEEPVTTTASSVPEENDITAPASADSPSISAPAGNDKTVPLTVVYTLRSKIISEETALGMKASDGSQNPVQNQNQGQKEGSAIDISKLYENSSAVVLANLDEIVYTSIDGEAYTAENITVSRVFKGELSPDDRITVFFGGGYVPAEVFTEKLWFSTIDEPERYTVRVIRECKGEQYEGQSYLFFLGNNSYPIPEGGFVPRFDGDTSVFRINNGVCTSVGDRKLEFMISSAENGFQDYHG